MFFSTLSRRMYSERFSFGRRRGGETTSLYFTPLITALWKWKCLLFSIFLAFFIALSLRVHGWHQHLSVRNQNAIVSLSPSWARGMGSYVSPDRPPATKSAFFLPGRFCCFVLFFWLVVSRPGFPGGAIPRFPY